MHRSLLSFIALILLFISITASAGNAPQVMVSIKPIHSIVAGLMQGVGNPELIVKGTATPYGYKLMPDQLTDLATADLIIWTGKELEPFLVNPLAELNSKTTILELLDSSRLKILPARGQADDVRDPFFWLDTRNALILVNDLAMVLITIDPENTDTYHRNRNELVANLEKLDKVFENNYRSVNAGNIILYHDTQQYFEQAFGTKVELVLSPAPGKIPTTESFLKAAATIKEAGVNCILTETGLTTDNLFLLTSNSGINTVELDSFGTRFEPGTALYADMMRANFTAIKHCNGITEKTTKTTVAKESIPPVTTTTKTDNNIPPGSRGGRYILQNHLGQAVMDTDFHDTYQLITFGYTSCPDICPTSLQTISSALKALGDKAEKIQPIFITLDPERDTTTVLKQYVGFFHPRMIGLTGSTSAIKAVAKKYKVRYEKEFAEGADPDSYSVNHSTGIFLFGKEGVFLKTFPHRISPKKMAELIDELIID